MVPADVSMTTTGLPGPGCSGGAGAGVCRRKPSKARSMDIRFDRRPPLPGNEHGCPIPARAPKRLSVTIQANGSFEGSGGRPHLYDVTHGAIQLSLFAGGQ